MFRMLSTCPHPPAAAALGAGAQPDPGQRPGSSGEGEWGEPGAEWAQGQQGARHTQWHSCPSPTRAAGGKVDPGLPEHLFLETPGIWMFCAISVYECWRPLQTFSQLVGELWSGARPPTASALGPADVRVGLPWTHRVSLSHARNVPPFPALPMYPVRGAPSHT